MPDFLLVTTTASTQSDAQQIARTVVQLRLAACVQVIGPVQSVYWWQGKVETADEWMCLVKTSADRYAELEQTIRAVHSYQLPEIVAVPITGGSPAYLAWLKAELGEPKPAP